MAKVKPSNAAGGVPNKILYSRVSYLYQAAVFLSAREYQQGDVVALNLEEAKQNITPPEGVILDAPSKVFCKTSLASFSQKLVSDLRSVSLKAQIRLSPVIKHSICKRCDIILIDGSTCTNEVENKSKHGRKPWADVLIRKCNGCGFERRFPLAVERQLRRHKRPRKTMGTHSVT